MDDYKTTVGIEVHAELKTNTKIFSSSCNGYANMANTHVNVIDLGYPGTLPTLNEEVIKKAIKAAYILNCQINKRMHFDRKNYFYPDLPKGYQITQARTPIGVDGYVEIEINGTKKKIGIHDIHIEEDTCKSIHYNNSSLLDFNRAGVPLIEIVTKPDIASGKEAVLYLEKLRELLLYADISDCKIEEGSMRCDVNVSVSKTSELGTKIEIKNIGSISNVGLAVDMETKRQIELLEGGNTLHEETRRFDEKGNRTVLMRVKETGNDYRYFPEADIPFVVLTDDYIEKVVKDMPMLFSERRDIYLKNGISEINVNKILQNRTISDYLNRYLDKHINLVIASNLLLGDIANYINKNNVTMDDTCFNEDKFIQVVNMLDQGDMSSKMFKEIINDLFESNDDINTLLQRHGITKLEEDDLKAIIQNIINSNQDNVLAYKNGNDRLFKYFVGQVMKETKGSADPLLVNKILQEELMK